MFINKNEAFDIMDSGILNDALRGYLACAMHISGSNNEQINKVIDTLYYVFDAISAERAEQYFEETEWIK